MVGAEVRMPPMNSLPNYKVAGETSAQRYWLYEEAAQADTLIVSLETLTLGGALPARRSAETLATVLQRLEVLRELRRRHAHLKILAHGALLHVSQDAHDLTGDLEKPYFAEWGEQLRAYSTAADRRSRYGEKEQSTLDAARDALPAEVLEDWLKMRERHLQLHLSALEMVRAGVIDHLALTLESSEAYGLDALERRQLEERTDELNLWPQVDIYPGGDEAACTLMARALEDRRLRAWVRYSGELGKSTELLNADRVTAEVLRSQLRAAGCVQASSLLDADFVLLINTPAIKQGTAQPNHATVDTVQRNLPAFVDSLKEHLNSDKPVVLADIAYLGSAEKRLWNMMQRLPLHKLSGYSAWGSAGSSLGSAIAFGKLGGRVVHKEVQRQAVFNRLMSDGLYQTQVRPKLEQLFGTQDPEAQRFATEKNLQGLLNVQVQDFWQQHFLQSSGFYLHVESTALVWPPISSGVITTFSLSEEPPAVPEVVEVPLTQPITPGEGFEAVAGAPALSETAAETQSPKQSE